MKRIISEGLSLSLALLVGCATEASVSGLKPLYPKAMFRFVPATIPFVAVDSLQPTLKWESLPALLSTRKDLAEDKDGISNIRYDLRIWRAGEMDKPVELIYGRKGLTDPFHRVETPLRPATKYLWTVRASFEINGRPKVTDWGVLYRIPPPSFEIIPKSTAYRFATPAH